MRAAYVRNWWRKAEESLASARRECEHGALFVAVSRLYYAAFYAVQAWLSEQGMHARTHAGVRHAFHQHLIRPGLLDRRWGRLYDRLFDDRTTADYDPFPRFEKAYVEELIAETAGFLGALKELIPSLSRGEGE